MRAIGIIPARLAATRLPNKPLLDICGKPMVEHVWERSSRAKLVDEVLVATPDEQIVDVCSSFGARAVLTSPDHQTGTDRVAEAATLTGQAADLVLNIQGDEPLIEPEALDALVAAMASAHDAALGSLMFPLAGDDDPSDPNLVKVVVDAHDDAIYFSRSPVPYPRGIERPGYWGHIGVYAWRSDSLQRFTKLERVEIEVSESLEQLRALHAGWKIKMVRTSYRPIGVDTGDDLNRVRAVLGG